MPVTVGNLYRIAGNNQGIRAFDMSRGANFSVKLRPGFLYVLLNREVTQTKVAPPPRFGLGHGPGPRRRPTKKSTYTYTLMSAKSGTVYKVVLDSTNHYYFERAKLEEVSASPIPEDEDKKL